MTRENEILNKAIDYSEIEENFLEYDDCGDTCNDKAFVEKAFIVGAKWADARPNKELVYTKQELMDMGFGFDLNGNIETIQAIDERTKKYINYRKNKWVEKACEWLIGEFLQMQDRDGYPNVESRSYISVEELIQGFHKAMEE